MRGKITKRFVDSVIPGGQDQFCWDTDIKGFGLKVTPSGKKIYMLQYRVGRRGSIPRRFTIGLHGSPWTPDAARTEARRLLGLVAGAIDPAEAKAAARSDLSIAACCDQYLADAPRMVLPGKGRPKEGLLAHDRPQQYRAAHQASHWRQGYSRSLTRGHRAASG
ncbi:MAG: DUF4102 domain-containing protein [Alphaproteobacteria bacterium]|nr:DUF4102 domain-containing protein [Alphaproteobacteria bacterium]